jgi:hypothetical protein
VLTVPRGQVPLDFKRISVAGTSAISGVLIRVLVPVIPVILRIIVRVLVPGTRRENRDAGAQDTCKLESTQQGVSALDISNRTVLFVSLSWTFFPRMSRAESNQG